MDHDGSFLPITKQPLDQKACPERSSLDIVLDSGLMGRGRSWRQGDRRIAARGRVEGLGRKPSMMVRLGNVLDRFMRMIVKMAEV